MSTVLSNIKLLISFFTVVVPIIPSILSLLVIILSMFFVMPKLLRQMNPGNLLSFRTRSRIDRRSESLK